MTTAGDVGLPELTARCFQLFRRYYGDSGSNLDVVAGQEQPSFAHVQSVFHLQQSPSASNNNSNNYYGKPDPGTIGFTMHQDAVFVEYPLGAPSAQDMRSWVLTVLEWAETVLQCRRLYLCVSLPSAATQAGAQSLDLSVIRSLLYVGFQLFAAPSKLQLGGEPRADGDQFFWLSYEL